MSNELINVYTKSLSANFEVARGEATLGAYRREVCIPLADNLASAKDFKNKLEHLISATESITVREIQVKAIGLLDSQIFQLLLQIETTGKEVTRLEEIALRSTEAADDASIALTRYKEQHF